jgi:membrane protein implicated in regulation of membrane protease activity
VRSGAPRTVLRMPGFTWPPRDTDRNRFLCRLQVVVYALVTLYFGTFALATGAFLPWAIFTVALAATIVVAAALLLMRAQRQESQRQESQRQESQRQDDQRQGLGR